MGSQTINFAECSRISLYRLTTCECFGRLKCPIVYRRKKSCIVAIICMIVFYYVFSTTLRFYKALQESGDAVPLWKISEKDIGVLNARLRHQHMYNAGRQKIAIITIVDASTTKEALTYAMNTVACYARAQSYEYRIINESLYYETCHQTKSQFRRHCIIEQLLPNYHYVLFLIPDIGVVNPKRRIEEFLDENADITFVDRFHRVEIMPGSYLVKNTRWARNFLRRWANYEQRLPHSFHGGDLGALYFHLAESTTSGHSVELSICRQIWEKCNCWQDLFVALTCVRNIIGETVQLGKVKILKKGNGWVRDSSVTDEKISLRRDFMFYNMELKERRNSKMMKIMLRNRTFLTYSWYKKFASDVSLYRCFLGNTTWKYDEAFLIGDAALELRYMQLHREIYHDKLIAFTRTHEFLNDMAKKPEKYVFRETGFASD